MPALYTYKWIWGRFKYINSPTLHSASNGDIMPSHGSLTKAGKVRMATPKIPPKPKKNLIPRRRNFRNYKRRIVYAPLQRRR